MKTKLFFMAILGLTLSTFSYAQFDASNLKVGASLVYATDIDNIGLGVNGVYSITDQWAASVGFTHIFEKNTLSYNILDFDAHYNFYSLNDKTSIYALAGLEILMWKWEYSYSYFGYTSSGSESGSDVGFNIGAGMNIDLSDKLSLAPEFKFTLGDGSYARIGAAVLYNF